MWKNAYILGIKPSELDDLCWLDLKLMTHIKINERDREVMIARVLAASSGMMDAQAIVNNLPLSTDMMEQGAVSELSYEEGMRLLNPDM